jgi:hypothetical protein
MTAAWLAERIPVAPLIKPGWAQWVRQAIFGHVKNFVAFRLSVGWPVAPGGAQPRHRRAAWPARSISVVWQGLISISRNVRSSFARKSD